MRRDFLVGIGLLASVGAGAGSALAADMPVRSAPAVAAPASCCAVPDWAGFYVGIHGGGGWGHKDFEPTTFFSDTEPGQNLVPPNASPKGGVFGFQFGHNWQWGPVVGGLEIDYSGADLKEGPSVFSFPDTPYDTFTRETRIDALASARGRLGYLILPNWLLYGTAGIGWGHQRLTTTDTFVSPPKWEWGSTFSSVTTYNNEFGWVAGLGVEWKFWPGSNSWLLRGEWLHYDFGRVTYYNQAFSRDAFIGDINVRTTVDVARAALSYKF
jgi:outer membrane immunogenic protein